MTTTYFPALSTFEVSAAERLGIGCDVDCARVGADQTPDAVELKFSPSGLSVRGRYWREGNFLKAAVHIQAAGGAPRTITAQVDLRPIHEAWEYPTSEACHVAEDVIHEVMVSLRGVL